MPGSTVPQNPGGTGLRRLSGLGRPQAQAYLESTGENSTETQHEHSRRLPSRSASPVDDQFRTPTPSNNGNSEKKRKAGNDQAKGSSSKKQKTSAGTGETQKTQQDLENEIAQLKAQVEEVTKDRDEEISNNSKLSSELTEKSKECDTLKEHATQKREAEDTIGKLSANIESLNRELSEAKASLQRAVQNGIRKPATKAASPAEVARRTQEYEAKLDTLSPTLRSEAENRVIQAWMAVPGVFQRAMAIAWTVEGEDVS